MSSGYLTSRDMNVIERLLAEIREKGCERDFGKETAAARMLVHAVEQGSSDETTLRTMLAGHVDLHRTLDIGLSRWADESGAIKIPA